MESSASVAVVALGMERFEELEMRKVEGPRMDAALAGS